MALNIAIRRLDGSKGPVPPLFGGPAAAALVADVPARGSRRGSDAALARTSRLGIEQVAR
jgi:hypothetical protein